MAHERLVMVAAWTRTVEYPQYARTEVTTATKSEMIWRVVADPGNIVRSIAEVATSQRENNDHNDGEGIGD